MEDHYTRTKQYLRFFRLINFYLNKFVLIAWKQTTSNNLKQIYTDDEKSTDST